MRYWRGGVCEVCARVHLLRARRDGTGTDDALGTYWARPSALGTMA